jgi:hypothetical protein
MDEASAADEMKKVRSARYPEFHPRLCAGGDVHLSAPGRFVLW